MNDAREKVPKQPLFRASMPEFFGMQGNVVVGLVHYVYHRSCWSIENNCYLQDLFVDPGVRGKSIGRALIEAVYDASDEAEHPSVYWQTQHFNATGRRLYDRVGEQSPFIAHNRPGYDA